MSSDATAKQNPYQPPAFELPSQAIEALEKRIKLLGQLIWVLRLSLFFLIPALVIFVERAMLEYFKLNGGAGYHAGLTTGLVISAIGFMGLAGVSSLASGR